METIFSVPSTRKVSESGAPCTSSGDDMNTLPAHLSGTKFSCSSALGSVLHQERILGTNVTPLLTVHSSSSASHAAQLMRFADTLSLNSMKSSIDDSPLVDDEDDDMRSLLAAAAAVAASVSPGSPHLRSSSSGLNTPPDTRVCRSPDDVIDDRKVSLELSEHGLHTVTGAALFVSRLESTAAALANPDDPLGICLPSATDTTLPICTYQPIHTVHYSPPVNTPSTISSQFFSIRSPLPTPPEHRPPASRTSPLLRNPLTDAIRFHNSTSFISDPIFDPQMGSPKCLSPRTPPQQDIKVDYDLPSRTTNTSAAEQHSPNLTSNVIHANSLAPSSSTCTSQSDSPSAAQLRFSSAAPTCLISSRQRDSLPNCSQTTPSSFPSSLTTDSFAPTMQTQSVHENSVDPYPMLDSLFDTHSVVPHTSVTLSEKSLYFTQETSTVQLSDTEVENDDQGRSIPCSNSALSVNLPVDTKCPSAKQLHDESETNGDRGTTDLELCDEVGTQSSNKSYVKQEDHPTSAITCDIPLSSDQLPVTPTVSSPKERGVKSETLDSCYDLVSTEQALIVPPVDSSVLSGGSTETIKSDETSKSLAELIDLEALVRSSKLHDPDAADSVKAKDCCEESEYVSAAVAAVEAVVYALAGNRKPDPALATDPALEGTGTDRILSLSLAPVHSDSSVLSQSPNVSLLSTNAACSIYSAQNLENSPAAFRSTAQSSGRLSETPSFTPTTTIAESLTACTNYHQPVPSNASSNGIDDHSGRPDLGALTGSKWDSQESKGEFVCSACNRVFPQKALLLKHRIMHGEPKHACDACGKCFVREDKLKRHVMSIHTAEKPHICDICDKAFSRKDKLKDHLKHHERAARNFECPQCQQRFVQKSDLNRHIRGVHQGEPGIGINMGTKRRAPGLSPTRLCKKKTKPIAVNSTTRSAFSAVNNTDPTSRDGSNTNSRLSERRGSSDESAPSSSSNSADSINPSVASATAPAIAAVANLNNFSTMAHATHPMFATGAASQLMFPAMTFQQAAVAQQQLVQQQQAAAAAAAAAAAVMLPGGGTMTAVGPAAHQQSSLALQNQQQQHQFFSINALPSTALAQTGSQTQAQHVLSSNPAAQQVQLQSELKAVATPSGPMMVLTRIAAANQASQVHQLASQAVFPHMVGFHSAGTQQHLQQLQQQAVVAQHQQQLLQQQHANYAAAAAAAAAAGTQLVAVSNSQAGAHLNATATGQAGSTYSSAAHQFHLHQQATQQLQQHQQAAAALAARQHAAHSFLFPSAASAAAPASFFCHPQDGVTAGLILASSADPASFALAAAAQAQAAAAAAVAQQQASATVSAQAPTGTALSASAIANATGLHVVTGYPDATVAQHQQHQLLLHQQHQQRLAAVAAAANVVTTSVATTPNNMLVAANSGSSESLVNGTNSSVLVSPTQEDQLRQRATTQISMAQPDCATAMNNCYQLAAALYHQHHPGLMFAAANTVGSHSVASTAGTAVAAMALQQQQYQQQAHQQHQQQAGILAAYQQHSLQQHSQLIQRQQQQHQTPH